MIYGGTGWYFAGNSGREDVELSRSFLETGPMCENQRFRWGAFRIGGPAMPVLLAVILCTPSIGRTITVDDNGPADFRAIQAAIDDANDRDVVIVQPGTYVGWNIDFRGRAITVRSVEPNDPHVVEATIVDCVGNRDYPLCGFIFSTGEGHDSILSGLTIRNGYGLPLDEDYPEYTSGGGIICCDASPTIEYCRIEDNMACYGAGVYCNNAGPLIRHCRISGNSGDDYGGFVGDAFGAGVYCSDSNAVIEDCIITNNRAHLPGNVSLGGAFYIGGDGRVTISRCTITGNTSRFDAAAIYHSGSRGCVIRECYIADNNCGFGLGAVVCEGHSVVAGCLFSNNPDGALVAQGDSLVTGCTVTENHRSPSAHFRRPGGAGITCADQTQIKNCVITGNRSYNYRYDDDEPLGGNGAGIYCLEGTPTITSCTIMGNIADDHGGGIYVEAGEPNVTNCIVWGNKSTDDTDIFGESIVSYSNIAGGWPGSGNTNAYPLFADPGFWHSNDTPETSHDDFWVYGDYHLQSQAGRWDPNSESWVRDEVTSSCVDAGDPMSPIGQEPFPNGGVVNMGAYGGTSEASKSWFGGPVCETIVAGDVNGDCVVDFRDLSIMMSHWLDGDQ